MRRVAQLSLAWRVRNRAASRSGSLPRRRGTPRLLHTVVKLLRRKLGDDAENPVYILNERGVGYRLPTSPGQDDGGGD